MHTRFVLSGILMIVGLTISSCTVAKISGRGPLPIVLNNLPEKSEVLSHFSESKMIVFDYTGAFDVSEIIANKLAQSKADAVTNITVTIKVDGGSFFLNLLTLGIANAKVVVVEGDLIKLPGSSGSLIRKSHVLFASKDLDAVVNYFRDINFDFKKKIVLAKNNLGFFVIDNWPYNSPANSDIKENL